MLSIINREQVLSHNNITKSLQRITDKVKRSVTAIYNCLQNGTVYGSEKYAGRSVILLKRSKRLITCSVVSKRMTALET